jgi:hypothetical protein
MSQTGVPTGGIGKPDNRSRMQESIRREQLRAHGQLAGQRPLLQRHHPKSKQTRKGALLPLVEAVDRIFRAKGAHDVQIPGQKKKKEYGAKDFDAAGFADIIRRERGKPCRSRQG